MGSPMALNLQKSGFEVNAFDFHQSIYEKLQQQSIFCCDSIKGIIGKMLGLNKEIEMIHMRMLSIGDSIMSNFLR